MTKPVRCWHLLSNRWNSAITEYALSAVKSLNLAGTKNLFSPLQQSPAELRAKKSGIALSPFPDFGLGQIRHARSVFRDFSPDILFVYGGPETALSAFLPGMKAKIRFRGHDLLPSMLGNIQQRLSHLHVDRIVVPGINLQKKCVAIFGKEKICTVTLGCDSELFFRKEPKIMVERPEFLIFGRFDAVKGHQEFLAIFRKILNRWPENIPAPQLTFAGQPEGISAETLHKAALAAGVPENNFGIRTGRFEDVCAMMSAATVGVVSSLGSEQICRVAEEFLLCGTPVAVSGVGSLEDVLFHNSGLSYRGHSPEDTAAMLSQLALKSFAENEAQRKERATAARKYFSLEKMGKELLAAAGISL